MTKNINDNTTKVRKIAGSTQVIFTISGFAGLIFAILLVFIGFYSLVILPKENTIEHQYQKMYDDQKEQNRIYYDEFSNIYKQLGTRSYKLDSLKVDYISKSKNN